MVIYLGADHRGFQLKESLKKVVADLGYEVEDTTPEFKDGDDYPDAARIVAEKVIKNIDQSRGILICGSGAGVDIVANKFPQIRSVLGITTDQVFDARHDDNVNILSLAADFIKQEDVEKITRIFLETKFEDKEERFRRRIIKIMEIEREVCGPDML